MTTKVRKASPRAAKPDDATALAEARAELTAIRRT